LSMHPRSHMTGYCFRSHYSAYNALHLLCWR
jgi:hypothetical protein